MAFERFSKINKRTGKPKTCKFCHQDIWHDAITGRIYDVGGVTLHIESCELRREFFHNRALDAAEERRK